MKAVKEKEQLQKTLDSWKDSSKNLWRLILARFTKTSDFKGVPHPLSGDYTPTPQEELDESLYVYVHDLLELPLNIMLILNLRFQVYLQKFKELLATIKRSCKPKVNQERIRNATEERKLGEGYSFTKKKCFVCGSLSHLIKDCDYYEKKMAREAEFKKQRVFNTGNEVAKPVWTNANRVNHANKLVPRSVQLNAGRPNINSVRPNINTGRTNINSVRPNINTGRTNINPVRPRVNTGSSNVNTVRTKQSVPTKTSNSFKRPQGNWGSAVKTSAGYNWRNSNPNSNCDSGPTFIRTMNDHPLKNMVDRGIFDSGCSGHMTGNKDQLEDFEEFNGGSVTFGGSKGYISGKGKIRVGNLDFDSVSFVKELGHFNLFSISQICDKQHEVYFLLITECLVVSSDFKMPDENQILLKVPRHHNMYSFDMKNLLSKDTLSVLGKFDGKSDEGFLVGYSLNSKAYRVYNLVTKRVEVNLHVNFLEDKPNVKGVGYRWMFDIDYLTDSMNYIPVSLENQANPHAGASEVTNSAGTPQTPSSNASEEKDEDVELIVVPSTVRNTEEKAESRKSSTNSKKEEILTELQQEKKATSTDTSEDNPKILAFRRELEEIALKHLGNVSENTTTSTPSVNTGSEPVNTGSFDPDDSPMPELEIFHKSDTGIFDEASYDEEGVITDFNSLPTEIEVSPTPTLRIHNIHPKSQILGDPKSAVQTRSKVQQKSGAHALFSFIQKQQRNNHKDQQHCLFACFLSQEEPKKIAEALQDDSWVQAMQEELLQFKLQQVWVLVDLPQGMKVIGTKWVYRNKRDERGVVVRNKAKLVAQKVHKYNDVKSAFLLSLIDERTFLYHNLLALLILIILRKFIRWSKLCMGCATLSTFLEKHGYKRGTIDKTLFIKRDKKDIMLVQVFSVTPKTSHLNVVKRIFKYLKGKSKIGLRYPKSPPLTWKHSLTVIMVEFNLEVIVRAGLQGKLTFFYINTVATVPVTDFTALLTLQEA
ncbi:putative ribonuclease H-like domain-containing protein [Tanacetum coccineum]